MLSAKNTGKNSSSELPIDSGTKSEIQFIAYRQKKTMPDIKNKTEKIKDRYFFLIITSWKQALSTKPGWRPARAKIGKVPKADCFRRFRMSLLLT